MTNRLPVPKPKIDLCLSSIYETVSSKIDNFENDEEREGIIERKESTDELSDSLSLLEQEILSYIDSTIKNTVVAVAEEEYNRKFTKYDTPMKRDILRAGDEDGMSLDDYDDDSNSSSSIDDSESEEEEEEEEEEDLIDKAALQRARELREQVRKKAAEIKAIKDYKIATVLQYVTSQLDEWKRLNIDQSLNEKLGSNSDDGNTVKSNKTHQRLQHMKSSLSKLEYSLQSIDVELPDKLESLQQTIETIQHHLQKQTKQKSNDKHLSRTERAILSRVDTNKNKSSQRSISKMEELDSIASKLNDMDAEQRFASFVTQVDPW